MEIKYGVVSVRNGLTDQPVNRMVVQHVRTLSESESLAIIADYLGYKAPVVKAALVALAKAAMQSNTRGFAAMVDGVSRFGITCRGSFDSASGPWVKGKNALEVGSTELEPWKYALNGADLSNVTTSAKPIIDTVLDTVTNSYNELTGSNAFSIGGNNLAPNTEAADEGVFFKVGETEIKADVTYSDLGMVRGAFAEPPAESGTYQLIVRTRCGFGEGYELKEVVRNIAFVAA